MQARSDCVPSRPQQRTATPHILCQHLLTMIWYMCLYWLNHLFSIGSVQCSLHLKTNPWRNMCSLKLKCRWGVKTEVWYKILLPIIMSGASTIMSFYSTVKSYKQGFTIQVIHNIYAVMRLLSSLRGQTRLNNTSLQQHTSWHFSTNSPYWYGFLPSSVHKGDRQLSSFNTKYCKREMATKSNLLLIEREEA